MAPPWRQPLSWKLLIARIVVECGTHAIVDNVPGDGGRSQPAAPQVVILQPFPPSPLREGIGWPSQARQAW